jgi:hypothetical protein
MAEKALDISMLYVLNVLMELGHFRTVGLVILRRKAWKERLLKEGRYQVFSTSMAKSSLLSGIRKLGSALLRTFSLVQNIRMSLIA